MSDEGEEGSKSVSDDEVEDDGENGVHHPDLIGISVSESRSKSHHDSIDGEAAEEEEDGEDLSDPSSRDIEALEDIKNYSSETSNDSNGEEKSNVLGELSGESIEEEDVAEVEENSEES